MTVKKLIEELSKLPQDLEVHTGAGHEFGDTNYLTIEKYNGFDEEFVLLGD